ncbi:dihydrofolate reductase family protein [Paenibacillus sp. Soil724D2]|uniref:dihydrofolate reductase family protein n=1 Tax=Paenibacillus sp. (strain Soil724D2) TaxID=1736392 RepID=UPI0007138B48|nr:dihydrofolate reductase family protein [Paenibacillus sp. Soil724D2]KRE49834.1 hypothetical protein ASG85_23470 [Paenibacillus sp. Soil724D2]
MRKVILFIHTSLDGYISGPNGEMDWIIYDEALQNYATDVHSTVDTVLYGRDDPLNNKFLEYRQKIKTASRR